MSKDIRDEDCIIQPRKSRMDPLVGPDVLIALVPDDLEYLVRLGQDKEPSCHPMGFFKIYQVTAERSLIPICGPFIGAPQAVMGLEKLIALGAARVWLLGWCGSLQSFLRIGDFVIPRSAVPEEGTSSHYAIFSECAYSDRELSLVLEESLRKRGQSCTMGKIWTTDAPYRETKSKVKSYQDQGVLAVEMEMSALMTVASYRGVKLTGLLVVSDELFSLKWKAGFRSKAFEARRRMAAKVLFEVLGGDGPRG